MVVRYLLGCTFNHKISAKERQQRNQQHLHQIYKSHLNGEHLNLTSSTIWRTIFFIIGLVIMIPLLISSWNTFKSMMEFDVVFGYVIGSLLMAYYVLMMFCWWIYMLIGKIVDCEYSILPDNYQDLKWEGTFESVDDTLRELDAIHYIMFDQSDAISECLLQNDMVMPEIASIIASYLWMELPTIQNIDKFRSCIKSDDNYAANILIDTSDQN